MADGRFAFGAKVFEMRGRIGAFVAGLAFDFGIGAVEFDETFGGRAGEGMEPVYVLGDEHEEFSGALEFDDGVMDGVGLRVAKDFPAFKFVIPMFDARSFGCHEVVVIDGLAASPNALWSAEIGNAALGGNARASEDQNACGGFKVVGQRRVIRHFEIVHEWDWKE